MIHGFWECVGESEVDCEINIFICLCVNLLRVGDT
jgi:hypothetical protein